MADHENRTFTITGRITNTAGEALPGLTVRAYLRTLAVLERHVGMDTTTDAEGNYQIEVNSEETGEIRLLFRALIEEIIEEIEEIGEANLFIRVFDGRRR